MMNSYFIPPQRIGEIIYEKAEVRRQRYANRRDSLGGTSSYRPEVGGSVMNNMFPARKSRCNSSNKLAVPPAAARTEPATHQPSGTSQVKPVRPTLSARGPNRSTYHSSVLTPPPFGGDSINLTIRGKNSSAKVCPGNSSILAPLRKSNSKDELIVEVSAVSTKAQPAAVLSLDALGNQSTEWIARPGSFERPDSLALSPSLIPQSPAPAMAHSVSPGQDARSDVKPAARKPRTRREHTDGYDEDTSEKEPSGSEIEVSFAGCTQNYPQNDQGPHKIPQLEEQTAGQAAAGFAPANSKDSLGLKDQHLRTIYSTNLQQQKYPRERYKQGHTHITSQQKSSFNAKQFLASDAQKSRAMHMEIEVYRQFCRQLIVFVAERRKLKQGLMSGADGQGDFAEFCLNYEDSQRLKNMGYDVSTLCQKLLTMTSKELENIEAAFEEELNSLRFDSRGSKRQQLNHEKIQADLRQLDKDVQIPRMRPNSANTMGLSMSDVKNLIYERQTNSLLNYAPSQTSDIPYTIKMAKPKGQHMARKQRNIKFDASLAQYAENKQEEYKKARSDLYLNKIYIKNLIDERLTELSNIERLDDTGRLIQSKPLLSIRPACSTRILPDNMALSATSTAPASKQLRTSARIVTKLPQVANTMPLTETAAEPVPMDEISQSISSESEEPYHDLGKTFRSAGDNYLMTASGHYDVEAPIKEEGKPYRCNLIVVTEDEIQERLREQEVAKQCSAEKLANSAPKEQLKPIENCEMHREVLDGNFEILYRYNDDDSGNLMRKQESFIRNRAPVNYKDIVNYFDTLSQGSSVAKSIKCALCGKVETRVFKPNEDSAHCISCMRVLALGKRS